MHSGKFVFSQVLARVPHWEFQRVARRHGVDSPKFKFGAWEHFAALVFAQLTFRESLRDIEACLSAQRSLAYHLGFHHGVRRSTLADANERRDWRFFSDIAPRMMRPAPTPYRAEPPAPAVGGRVYPLHATTLDLSFSPSPSST